MVRQLWDELMATEIMLVSILSCGDIANFYHADHAGDHAGDPAGDHAGDHAGGMANHGIIFVSLPNTGFITQHRLGRIESIP